MPPEWERRATQVPGAYRAVFWQGVLHVYNSDGFRTTGPLPRKDPSSFRVLVLGDSLTYGHGIEERFTYSRQLERLLRRGWRSRSSMPALMARRARISCSSLGA